MRTAIGENEDASLMLLFSCLGRYITLGMDTNSEIECIQRDMQPDMPYLMCYAAGEICPIESDGRLQNRYHNSSLIVCAIR